MIYLSGTYECKVDAKGRLTIPSGLKKDLFAILNDGFVLKPALFQNCIELFPMSQWDEQMAKLNKKLNKFNKKHSDFLRKYTAGVKKVEVDASGRILIPKDLMLLANISKEIVLSGVGNIVEIWDKAGFEAVIAEDDIADLAEEILGGENLFDELP